MASKLASKVLGLLTILLALSIIQVSARMTCIGTDLTAKKTPGLLCLEGYVPWDAGDCGNFCSCDGDKLKCSAPDNCTPEGYNSMEDFCAVGPNFKWGCQCPQVEKKDNTDLLLEIPFGPANPYHNTTVSGSIAHGSTSTSIVTRSATTVTHHHTLSSNSTKSRAKGRPTEHMSFTYEGPHPLTVESVSPAETTSTMQKRADSAVGQPSDKLITHGGPPELHTTHLHTIHATNMHTSMVPKSRLEQNAATCTFQLGNGGCEDQFPVEVVVSQGQCAKATNAFSFASYSYRVVNCDKSIVGCYLYLNNDNCNNGQDMKSALTYWTDSEQKCYPKPAGDGLAIGSIYCPSS